MSWLSELLGIEDKNKARNQQLAAQEAAKKAAEQEAAARQATASQWQSQLGSAASTGQSAAEQYFRSLGLDPAAYAGDISGAIGSIKSGIPQGGTIGGAFTGVGENVYNQLTDALRTRSLAGVNALETPEIAGTADDEIIAAILGEQRSGAEDYASNLMKRGVITDTGFQAAQGDIGRQADTAQGLLTQLGDTILGGGRSALDEILNAGKMTASNLMLGQNFNPASIGQNLQSSFDDFMAGLEGTFRSQAPNQLFNTAGLANVAGQAQGPQNLAFNPNAGYMPEEEEEDIRTATTVF